MSSEKKTKSRDEVQLGTYVFDRANSELRDLDGNIIHLRKQSAEVLATLARHEGEVVSKDDIIDEVWQGIATTDDSLVQCIADIRRTLGRDSVETFPKRGYRLRSGGTSKVFPTTKKRRNMLVAGVVAVFILAAFATVFLRTAPVDGQAIVLPAIAPDKTLAVLPFVNLSGDPELRFFSDGLSEDLATDLSKVPGLTVIAHRSSFDFRDAENGFKQIAEDLGVRFLVRGTVRHHAEQVRINVSLIDPFDGFNLWSERYDSKPSDTFDIQDEVILQIVQKLSLSLDVKDQLEPRIEPDAYFMLLRGLDALRQVNADGNLEARAFFERALQLDPQYARAHASLALTYGRETELSEPHEDEKQSIEKGLQAAITAIQLDPNMPHAYLALGVLNLALREHDHALAAARHAITLDGNYSDGYALLAEASVYGGDLEEALIAIERAKLLHPRHPSTYHWIEGHILFQLGRYDEAQRFLEAAVEDDPDFNQGLRLLAANYGQQGNWELAAKTIRPDMDLSRGSGDTPYRFADRHERVVEGLRLASVIR